MTTLKNRPNTALLVVDVQNGVVRGAHKRDAVVANVGSLVEKARDERIPVVWVQHSDEGLTKGSDDWSIVPELAPGRSEPLVEKSYGDSFEDTTLESVLSDLGVGRVRVPKFGPLSVRVPTSLDQSAMRHVADDSAARADSDWSTS